MKHKYFLIEDDYDYDDYTSYDDDEYIGWYEGYPDVENVPYDEFFDE